MVSRTGWLAAFHPEGIPALPLRSNAKLQSTPPHGRIWLNSLVSVKVNWVVLVVPVGQVLVARQGAGGKNTVAVNCFPVVGSIAPVDAEPPLPYVTTPIPVSELDDTEVEVITLSLVSPGGSGDVLEIIALSV